MNLRIASTLAACYWLSTLAMLPSPAASEKPQPQPSQTTAATAAPSGGDTSRYKYWDRSAGKKEHKRADFKADLDPRRQKPDATALANSAVTMTPKFRWAQVRRCPSAAAHLRIPPRSRSRTACCAVLCCAVPAVLLDALARVMPQQHLSADRRRRHRMRGRCSSRWWSRTW